MCDYSTCMYHTDEWFINSKGKYTNCTLVEVEDLSWVLHETIREIMHDNFKQKDEYGFSTELPRCVRYTMRW